MDTYHWLRVRTRDRSWAETYERFTGQDMDDTRIWGTFHGLFGIRSDELVMVLHNTGDSPADVVTSAGFELVETHTLTPTVRPERFEPLTRPGLYVFRLFEVAQTDVEEITQLSSRAWTTFENTDAYATEPQGLFCQADRSAPDGVMVLLTWYDGLTSWQASRQSAPEARENFRRRRSLTRSTIAYATRLVGT